MVELSQKSVPSLIADALRNAQVLFAKEVALFRAEVGDGVRALVWGLALVAMAALFLVTGLMVLIAALVKWLAVMLGSEALAALIVGGAFAVVAITLVMWGHSKMALSNLEPKRTERELRQDAAAIEERVRG